MFEHDLFGKPVSTFPDHAVKRDEIVLNREACLEQDGRIPTDAEIGEINATHLIDTPLRPADLLFVFGTRVDEVLRAEEAARLWRRRILREWDKIEPYKARGFIAEWPE